LNSQPEKTRRHLSLPLSNMSSCTKAPVSCSVSQGAVVSQARSRTIALPTRSASPGFMVSRRVMPLRLLSRPTTASRCAMGVPGNSVAPCAIRRSRASCS